MSQRGLFRHPIVLSFSLAVFLHTRAEATNKAENNDDLNLVSSWQGGAVPGPLDSARFSNVGILNQTVWNVNLGASLTWNQLSTTSGPTAFDVTIDTQTNQLTLGTGGIQTEFAGSSLTINGGTGPGEGVRMGIDQTWSAIAGSSITVNSVIEGASVKLTKVGGGTLNLNGQNTFDNGLDIFAGVVNLGQPAAVSPVNAITFTAAANTGLGTNFTGSLLNRIALHTPAFQENIVIGRSVGNDVVTLDGKITGGNANLSLVFDHFTGTNTTGGYILTNVANSFTANIYLNHGYLGLSDPAVLGNITNPIIIDADRNDSGTGLFMLAPGLNIPNPIQLSAPSFAAIVNVQGNDSMELSGTISSRIGISTANPFIIRGGVQNLGVSEGSVRLTGNNTYDNVTRVFADTRVVATRVGSLGSTVGYTTVQGDGTLVLSADGGPDLVLLEELHLNGNGVHTLTGTAGALQNLDGNNTVTGEVLINSDARIAVVGGSLNISGLLTGPGNLNANGVLQFSGDTSGYMGVVDVTTGILSLSGAATLNTSPAVIIAAGATLNPAGLGGTFTIASGSILTGDGSVSGSVSVASGGTLEARALTMGDLTTQNGSTYFSTISGTAPSSYGHTSVNGLVTLDNATLSLNLAYIPGLGDSFTIIENDLLDAVSGIFLGHPDQSIFNLSGNYLEIDYEGGDGNDVVLTTIPEPGSALLLAIGGGACLLRRRLRG